MKKTLIIASSGGPQHYLNYEVEGLGEKGKEVAQKLAAKIRNLLPKDCLPRVIYGDLAVLKQTAEIVIDTLNSDDGRKSAAKNEAESNNRINLDSYQAAQQLGKGKYRKSLARLVQQVQQRMFGPVTLVVMPAELATNIAEHYFDLFGGVEEQFFLAPGQACVFRWTTTDKAVLI